MKTNLDLTLCSKKDPQNPRKLRHLARAYYIENTSLNISEIYVGKEIQIPQNSEGSIKFIIEKIDGSKDIPCIEAVHEIPFYENKSNISKIMIDAYCSTFENLLEENFIDFKKAQF